MALLTHWNCEISFDVDTARDIVQVTPITEEGEKLTPFDVNDDFQDFLDSFISKGWVINP